MATVAKSSEIARGRYTRFDIPARIEHVVLLVSFTLLGVTGLPQKFASWPISEAIMKVFGGIEGTRTVHHISAIVLVAMSAYHIIAVGYRIFVLRNRLTMLPGPSDFADLWTDLQYYLGLSPHGAKYPRYSYHEKMEYWAMVWGTLVMGITGFMLWNPISTARLVPGEWIPAAKTAHGAEAILAVLAIILWHFYNVHIKTFNKSMFTGDLTEEQMAHEHGKELENIARGQVQRPIDTPVLRRRQFMYFPIATVIGVVLALGVYRFATLENTAPITTVPQAVANVPILVTATPSATPVRPATPTSVPVPTSGPAASSGGGADFATIQAMLQTKCGTCHGAAATAGLDVSTYATLMKGGATGPVITPKDPAGSVIVKKMDAGGHPAQLSPDELNALKAWIASGATEQAGGAAPAAGGPAAIPHDVARRENCLTCHDPSGSVKPAPKDHAGRTADTCQACHKPATGASGTTTPAAAGTPAASAPAGGKPTFVKNIQPLFQAKCAACHGSMGGLTLTTYESVMHGGTSGPAVVPNDPNKSSVVVKQAAGGHPGQLTPEELDLVRQWITAGAPEQ